MQKKIIKLFFLMSLVFIFPIIIQAASQCNNNATPDLQKGDPACYTSSTSYWTEYCSWSFSGVICDNVNADGTWAGSTFHTSSCSRCPKSFYNTCHGAYYVNSCSGSHCENAGALPAAGTRTHSSTSYTCYYTTVSEWSVCDVDTGLQSATDVTQNSTSGTSCDNLNEETTQICGVCGSANGVGTGEMPETADLCQFGTPTTPELNEDETQWEWGCAGDNGAIYVDDTVCAAPKEAPGICSTIYNGQAQNGLTESTEGLCTSGIVTNFIDHGDPDGDGVAEIDAGWSWTCQKIGDNPDHTNEDCQAPCFDYTIQADQSRFYWDDDDSVDITVDLQRTGRCADKYTCIVQGNETDGETTYTIEASEDGTVNYDLTATCTHEDDGTIVTHDPGADTVIGTCIERSCTSQGICQGIPKQASSSSSCASTCSSDSDCTTGRMIETRP